VLKPARLSSAFLEKPVRVSVASPLPPTPSQCSKRRASA
jgi:hypothetical protein